MLNALTFRSYLTFQVMTGFALQRRLQDRSITVSSVHPGIVSCYTLHELLLSRSCLVVTRITSATSITYANSITCATSVTCTTTITCPTHPTRTHVSCYQHQPMHCTLWCHNDVYRLHTYIKLPGKDIYWAGFPFEIVKSPRKGVWLK